MALNPNHKPVLAVLGVGPGIGEAVSQHFAAQGFAVALMARTEEKLRHIRNAIRARHGPDSAQYYVADARLNESVVQAFSAVKRDLGPVNVLVYNAGSRRLGPRTILETSPEEFESFTRINMTGAFFAARCVLPDMLAAGAGTIIFTGATASVRGSPGLGAFSPAKFGLRALSQVLAREFQAKGVHTAHVIVDGPVESDIIGGYVRKQWEKNGEMDKLKEVDRYLMQPADLAKLYWYLHTQPRSTWTQELDVRAEQEAIFSKL
ncbi:hypothetical protein NLU13_7451 [Sarocladium strictum]|uniref:Uncharacterized protein n=1 Tax=Sarocladium strictum TaxID=5046 RepID=A0AA39GE08_SARSR|nr:hypothetical protein NLU13_7451 [Sarocladium strictum]